MKGDFTRDTFDPTRHFSRVLLQQGRVQLDSDWNEQAAITLHYLRALAKDLIGPHGGSGFQIRAIRNVDGTLDLELSPGNYYVNGILCENGIGFKYTLQPGYPRDPLLPIQDKTIYIAYLDVWERHVTYHEEPAIRESALGGTDTATRTRVEWQVKLHNLKTPPPANGGSTVAADEDYKTNYDFLIRNLEEHDKIQPGDGHLAARVRPSAEATDACVVPSDNRYRGVENQLYRVEIHRPGTAGDGKEAVGVTDATFKWSRENGSVVFAVISVKSDSAKGTTVVILEEFGPDKKLDLSKDDWVELVYDAYLMRNDAKPLLRVVEIDRDEMTVILEGTVDSDAIANANANAKPSTHPLLRRWDHRAGSPYAEGALVVVEGVEVLEKQVWLELEDGIEIRFAPAGHYQTGDYWLIPARTATGDVEWPRDSTTENAATTLKPRLVRAQGVKHSYAPLAAVGFSGGEPKGITDLRRDLTKLWPPQKSPQA